MADREDFKTRSIDETKWSIPYIDQPLDFWLELAEHYQPSVDEIYIPLDRTTISSGRPRTPSKHLSGLLKNQPFPPAILINPVVLPKPVDELFPIVLEELKRLYGEFGIDRVTVSNAMLAKKIKHVFPSFKLTASTLMDVFAANQLSMIGDLFHSLVPSSRIVRDIGALKKLKKAFPGHLKLIVNESCLPNCRLRIQHFYEMGQELKRPKSLCDDLLKKHPWLGMTGSWVLPQHLDLYSDITHSFKLSGRVTLRNPSDYLKVLDSYINRIDLSPHEIGGGPASVTHNMTIDRKFFEATLNCKKNCDACDICKDYFHRTVKIKNEDFPGLSSLESSKPFSNRKPANPGLRELEEQIGILLREASPQLPSTIDLGKIFEQWRMLDGIYDIRKSGMPLPVWKKSGFTIDGDETWRILQRQIKSSEKDISIYLHVPFCRNRCAFCDCYKIPLSKHSDSVKLRFTEALISEIRSWTKSGRFSGKSISTVHFGGGTPDNLDADLFKNIVEELKSCFDISQKTEWAIETTGAGLERSRLENLRRMGFSRLHVGVQTLEPGLRNSIGRKTGPRELLDRLKLALEMGFITSVDIIYGLPRQSLNGFYQTLNQLREIKIDGFSLYRLNCTTGNFPALKRLGYKPNGQSLSDYLYFQVGHQFLLRSGYKKNHFVHFATERNKSLYSNHSLRQENLVALGPTADGVIGEFRYRHPKLIPYTHSTIGKPVFEGGLFDPLLDNRTRPAISGLMASRIDPAAFEALDKKQLIGKWQNHGLLKKYAENEYHLTGNGSWLIDQMLGEGFP